MRRFALYLALTAISFADANAAEPDTEITTSSAPTEYCFEQTSVRGTFENLIIDHNLIIPPSDHFKPADIFVAARFKSQPGALWLLTSGRQWKKIEKDDDLLLAQHQSYEELPLVVPVSVLYTPFDVSNAIGDGEIWIGYGLRSANETSLHAFQEMVQSQRYELLWQALPPPYSPVGGVKNPLARVCLTTSLATKTVEIFQAQ